MSAVASADALGGIIFQLSPPTPQKSYQKFQNPRTTFQNNPLSGPHNLFSWNPNIVATLQNYRTIGQPLLVEK